MTITRRFSFPGSSYECFSTVVFGQMGETAGEVEPMLDQPIDFDAELAERRETHGSVDAKPAADTSNTSFDI